MARLAGIPDTILVRAKEVLANLEKEELNETGAPRFAERKIKKGTVQLDLFSSINESVIAEIRRLDVKSMSQGDALKTLIALQKKLGLG